MRPVWPILLLFAAAACEDPTTGLDDASLADTAHLGSDGPSGADAAPASDADLQDAGTLPSRVTVVPCDDRAVPLPFRLAGGGPMVGELTVFVDRLGSSPELSGARVELTHREGELESLTDARGCARFVGEDLRGPVDLRVSAPEYSVVAVRSLGLSRARLLLISREALTGGLTEPAPPRPAVVDGEVTGWERLRSVTSTAGERRRNVARVLPLYPRHTDPRPYYEAASRPAPYERFGLETTLVGDPELGLIPGYVELVNYELSVDARFVNGLMALARHETRGSAGSGEVYDELMLGFTRALALTPGERASNVELALEVPLDRSMTVVSPPIPAWAQQSGSSVETYWPDADLVLPSLVREPDSTGVVTRLPALRGPLAGASNLLRFSATSTESEAAGPVARGVLQARLSRADVFTAPPFREIPLVWTEGRTVGCNFPGERERALVVFTAFSADGLLELWDLGDEPDLRAELPEARVGEAAPSGPVEFGARVLWPREPGSAEVRGDGRDPLDFAGIFWEHRAIDLDAP